MNTKKEIVDKCYKILGEDQSSTVFDKEGEVVPKINDTIDQICRCDVTNILTQQKIRGGLLDFLYEEKTIVIPKAKRLLEDINSESDYITVDTLDGLSKTGWLEIDGNIISYNGIREEDNALLKVSGINGPHDYKSTIHYAYILPANMMKAADFYDVDRQELLKFVDFREEIGYQRCYTIKPYKGRKVAIFYNIDSKVVISWTKKVEEMSSDDDECGLPDNYGLKIVPYLVVGLLLIDTSEVQKGEKLLAIGYSALEDMYSFYATPTKKFRKKIKITPLHDYLP